VNEATSRKLEFDNIRELLATYCGTSVGKRLARSITPATKTRLVREWLGQVSELMDLHEEYSMPPRAGVHDIREYVRSSAFPTPLEPEALAQIAETTGATASICAWFTGVGDQAPLLQALGKRIPDLSWIATKIYEAIDPRGEVRDYASPKLSVIRRGMEEARGRIQHVFDRILKQTSLTRMLQYASATFHNDRCVLPLKSEYRGRIPGIIHRSSDSGATLFVEPSESVELNNSLVRLREEETKEITRILRELSQFVQQHARVILSTLRVIGIVDLIAAKCLYAKKRSCVCPEINSDGIIDLHEGRHPILVELFERQAREGGETREVVPIDIRLGDDFDILVVTGPNTGGKTVALKTLGLFVMMTQCGIPIPAGKGSKMPVYADVYFDVGDEQSLQQSLSTFSSHLSTLLEILSNAGPRSLVLIDELGAGTDPDEGAAIGRAVVAELLQLKTKAIVTTHLSVLKAVAYTTARVDNAAVEFDPQSLRPTFHLRLGEPGNSNALIIAKRLGMSARMVKQAKSYLDDNARALNRAIAGTLDSRRQAEGARQDARRAQVEAQLQREAYIKHREQLMQSQAEFDRWTEWVTALSTGDDVYVRSLRGNAKVVRMELHKQKALISSSAMEIEVPLRDIEPPRET